MSALNASPLAIFPTFLTGLEHLASRDIVRALVRCGQSLAEQRQEEMNDCHRLPLTKPATVSQCGVTA